MSRLTDATSLILSRTEVRPEIGIILGSGLGAVADLIEAQTVLRYVEIPGIPGANVPGHKGELVIGLLDGREVVAMKGRVHLYQGHSPSDVAFPVFLLHSLGVRLLVVTNAAGGLKPGLKSGTLMLLEDHINMPGLAGQNPLVGVGGKEQFVNMVDAYDPELRRIALEEARGLGLKVDTGVYAMVAGPSFETPAEARFLRQIGADAVGMSTVPEVVTARYLGVRVLGISCITNHLFDHDSAEGTSHNEVLSVAEAVAPDLASLIRTVLRRQRPQDDT